MPNYATSLSISVFTVLLLCSWKFISFKSARRVFSESHTNRFFVFYSTICSWTLFRRDPSLEEPDQNIDSISLLVGSDPFWLPSVRFHETRFCSLPFVILSCFLNCNLVSTWRLFRAYLESIFHVLFHIAEDPLLNYNRWIQLFNGILEVGCQFLTSDNVTLYPRGLISFSKFS